MVEHPKPAELIKPDVGSLHAPASKAAHSVSVVLSHLLRVLTIRRNPSNNLARRPFVRRNGTGLDDDPCSLLIVAAQPNEFSRTTLCLEARFIAETGSNKPQFTSFL